MYDGLCMTVTMADFDAAAKEQLLRMVAEEFPIFVLGPGCYRVGFDDPGNTGWQTVEKRVADLRARLQPKEQEFLSEFFFSKLSDERREEPLLSDVKDSLEEKARDASDAWEKQQEAAHATEPANLASTPDAATQFELWRILLATNLLRAFRHASCCLGLAIGEGTFPVLQWQAASVPSESIADWSNQEDAREEIDDQALSGGEGNAMYHFFASRDAIRSAALVARAMERVARGERLTAAQSMALQEVPQTALPRELASFAVGPLEVLLPSRMAIMLDVLAERCFTPEPEPDALRGANIEWLGDLLWHVLVRDAEVQPSQADLAFYVTLSEQGEPSPKPRDLRRAAFGDRKARDLDLIRLTTRSQPDGQLQASGRDSLLRTIAMCLVAQYDIVEVAESYRSIAMYRASSNEDDPYTFEERPFKPALDRCVLALADDYGDRLERSIFKLLAEKAKFHIAVPVWLTADNSRELDWLLMDVQRDAKNRPAVEWRWLAEAEEVNGPVVIKLNGCDRCPMGAPFIRGNVEDFPISGEASKRHRRKTIDLAVLYTENDRLTAMQSFDDVLAKNKGGVAGRLDTRITGLRWTGRSWVIMGERFADWIPRLRLFTRKWVDSRDSEASSSTPYWAIDRSYDWPERTLLESLGITMIRGELERVVGGLNTDAFTGAARRTLSPVARRFAELLETLEATAGR